MQQGEEPLLALGSLHCILRGFPGAQHRPFCSPSKSTPESSQSKMAQPAPSGFSVLQHTVTRGEQLIKVTFLNLSRMLCFPLAG